jgi:hypothetical protein
MIRVVLFSLCQLDASSAFTMATTFSSFSRTSANIQRYAISADHDEVLNRLEREGRGDVISVSLHPGVIETNIWRDTTPAFRLAEALFIDKTIEQGSATTVYCSLSNEIARGGYYEDCKLMTTRNEAIERDDGTLRNSLWEASEQTIRNNGFHLPSKIIK